MPVLFSAAVCPFAHRTRALLTHLEVPFELREIDLKDKPRDFLELSPTGKVPLLVDGEVKLYESAVINDYLAEKHDFRDAYPAGPAARARTRLAMKQFDDVVLPAFYEGMKDPSTVDEARRRKVGRELDEIGHTAARIPSLLSFHVATFWVRWSWLREHTELPALIEQRPRLRDWFDEAVAHPAVQATLPDREETVALYLERYVGVGV